MTTEQQVPDEVTQDQESLTVEQSEQAPQYVTVEQLNAVQAQYQDALAQIKGLQGSIDRRKAELKRQNDLTQEQARLARMSEAVENISGDERVFYETQLEAQKRRVAELNQPTPEPQPTQPVQPSLRPQLEQALQDYGIDPKTPGIDYTIDVSNPEGQRAFMRNAIEADRQVRAKVQQQQEETVTRTQNPPIDGGNRSNAASYTTESDLADAWLKGQLNDWQYRQLLQQFR